MIFIPSNEIVFHKLNTKEELDRDELESRFCKIFGFDEYCEYIFLYTRLKDTYYCVLIKKDNLRKYTKDSKEILTHPIFLASQLGSEDCNFIITCNKEIQYVKYNNQHIVDFAIYGSFDEINCEILQGNTYLWNLDNTFDTSQLKLKQIHQSPNNLQITNLNQIPKQPPLLKQPLFIMIATIFCGILLGLAYPTYLNIKSNANITQVTIIKSEINQKLEVNNQNLQQEKELEHKIQQATSQLQALLSKQEQNKKILLKYGNTQTHIVDFFYDTYKYIKENNVKVKYIGYKDSSLFMLILKDSNAILTTDKLHNINNIQDIPSNDTYIFVEIMQ
ncbi:hypothetical protein [Helicobacter ibis]|uniref:Transmembrane protein n=1 Tax=Helicobacter ibis TaxID=2962633 RepID=A0ABT4VHX0_9HELI|nr:hypothetical protein [Helicobacter ibis]MDA3969641.1 hypothetical protein [Helicobacter ibis]